MASTQQMQVAAAERRRTGARAPLPNTVNWCDPDYGRRLARQMRNTVKSGGVGVLGRLESIRRHPAYVGEEPSAEGVRVFYLDGSTYDKSLLILTDLKFDRAGRLRAGFSTTIGLSDHFLTRAFERLRTNCRTDLLPVLRALCSLPVPRQVDLGRRLRYVVPGGRVCLVCSAPYLARGGGRVPPMWIARTFVARRKPFFGGTYG
jgi:hypothetical protein